MNKKKTCEIEHSQYMYNISHQLNLATAEEEKAIVRELEARANAEGSKWDKSGTSYQASGGKHGRNTFHMIGTARLTLLKPNLEQLK